MHGAKTSTIVDIAMDRNNYDGEVLAAVVHARMRRVGLSPLQPHLFDKHDLTIVLCAPEVGLQYVSDHVCLMLSHQHR